MAKTFNTVDKININGIDYQIGQRNFGQGTLEQIILAAIEDNSFDREIAFATTLDYGVIALFGMGIVFNGATLSSAAFNFINSNGLYSVTYTGPGTLNVTKTGESIENLIGSSYTNLDQNLYNYISTRYANEDYRTFLMEIAGVANWQGATGQLQPDGNSYGWYNDIDEKIIIISGNGIFELDNTYATRPIVNYNTLAERVIYDNSNSGLDATNVQEAIGELVSKEKHIEENAVFKGDYSPLNRDGLADNLASPDGFNVDEPFVFRDTAGDRSIISTGTYAGDYEAYAEAKSIRGNTWIYNQLVDVNSGYFANKEIVGINVTVNKLDGTITLNGTATENQYISMNYPATTIGNVFIVFADDTSIYPNINGTTIIQGNNYKIITATTANTYVSIFVENGRIYDNVTFKVRLVNLTKMFGAGKEPATVAEFNNLTRGIIDWYYSEGEMLNAKIDGVKSVGFNAFDGELELGAINNQGQPASSGYDIRTKNFIETVCGKKYTLTWVNSNDATGNKSTSVFEYDESQQFVKKTVLFGVFSTPKEFTLTDRTCYIKIVWYHDGVTTSVPTDAQICFHLTHSGYRNGQYEPYWDETRTLPVNQYFPHGMKSAGNAYDELTSKRASDNIGNNSLSSFTFRRSSRGFFWVSLSGVAKAPSTNAEKANISCTKYQVVSREELPNVDKSCAIDVDGSFLINDTSYTDVDTFTNAVAGESLNYERANPIVTEISDEESWFVKVDDFGTEEQIISDGFQVPAIMDIHYVTNIRDFVRNIGLRPDVNYDANNIVSQEQLQAEMTIREQLKETLGGTLRQVLATSKGIDFNNTAWVDLGTLTYYKANNAFSADFVGAKNPENNNTKANILCSKYATETKAVVQYNVADKTIAIGASGQVFIQDSDCADETALKQSLANVIMAYEKA